VNEYRNIGDASQAEYGKQRLIDDRFTTPKESKDG